MEKILKDTLTQLGLTPKEIRFFLACFKIGPATVNEIAHEAKLQRSTAYIIAEDLLEKKLLEENLHRYKKKVRTVDPGALIRILAAKQRILGRQELELKEHLPELQALHQASEVRPKVKVFEGIHGLSAVEQDVLSAKGEILLWSNQETERTFFTPAYHEKFIEERKKRGIFIRVLAVDNDMGRELKRLDSQNMRETRLLPKNISFTSETYIYDNTIAILDHKKDIIGISIYSEPIVAAQKAIFELSWNHCR